MPDTNQTPVPADLDAFDFDAFIDGIVQPSKVVAVAQNRALGQQLQEALQTVTDLQLEESNAKAEGRPSKRRAATTESPELDAARQHLADLEQQAAKTFVYVRIEGGLTRAVREQAVKDAGETGGVGLYNQSVLAHVAQIYKLDPRTHPDAPGRLMSVDQWGKFAEAIGYLQWDAIINALAEVTATGVAPDFSQPPSASPDGGTSSKS